MSNGFFGFPVHMCDIITSKKYIFGYLDDQKILLRYIWSSSMVPENASGNIPEMGVLC